MKWLRLILTLAAIAALYFYLHTEVSPEAANGMLIGVGVAILAMSTFLDDKHSVWLARLRNVPIWGQAVLILFVIGSILPVLWRILGEIWEEINPLAHPTESLIFFAALVGIGILGWIQHQQNKQPQSPFRPVKATNLNSPGFSATPHRPPTTLPQEEEE